MVVRSLSSGRSSLDSHGQARRYARILVRKTLGYCADREVDQLKRVRAYLLDLADSRPHVKQAHNWRAAAMLLDQQATLFNRHYQHALQESMDAELGVALPEPVDIHVGRADLAEGLDGMSLSLIPSRRLPSTTRFARWCLCGRSCRRWRRAALTSRPPKM